MYDPLIDEPIEHKKSMKTNLLVTVMILIVGSFIPAQAGTKEDVKSAIKKLAEKGNYRAVWKFAMPWKGNCTI